MKGVPCKKLFLLVEAGMASFMLTFSALRRRDCPDCRTRVLARGTSPLIGIWNFFVCAVRYTRRRSLVERIKAAE